MGRPQPQGLRVFDYQEFTNNSQTNSWTATRDGVMAVRVYEHRSSPDIAAQANPVTWGATTLIKVIGTIHNGKLISNGIWLKQITAGTNTLTITSPNPDIVYSACVIHGFILDFAFPEDTAINSSSTTDPTNITLTPSAGAVVMDGHCNSVEQPSGPTNELQIVQGSGFHNNIGWGDSYIIIEDAGNQSVGWNGGDGGNIFMTGISAAAT